MKKSLLTLLIFGLSFCAGTAHAYLSPGEVFPDLKTTEEDQAQEAPLQALPVLLDKQVHSASTESTLSSDMLYIGGGFIVAIGLFAFIATRKRKKEAEIGIC